MKERINIMNFPTAKDLRTISEDVSINDGNEVLYNEYLEDLKKSLIDMAFKKNREIYVPYRYVSNSYYGELALMSRRGYLDVNYSEKVFKMLSANGYEYYHYLSNSGFSRKGQCRIWIKE